MTVFHDPAPHDAPRAVARRTDPVTSWAAAQSVEHIRISQQRVHTILSYRDGTDHDIAQRYQMIVESVIGWEPQSPSGLRTRRKELCDLGVVFDSGRTELLPSGRYSIVWTVNKPGGTVPSHREDAP